MAEPPSKRPKRIDSAAMWDKTDTLPAPRSPRPGDDALEARRKGGEREDRRHTTSTDKRRDGHDARPRSRSREQHERRRDRERSRSKDRSHRDRDRDKEREHVRVRGGGRDRDIERDGHSRRDRERSRSRDRYRASKDHSSYRRSRSRSRSPARNGTNPNSTRTRSPPHAPRGARPDRGDHRHMARDRERDSDKPSSVKRDPEAMHVDAKPAVAANGHDNPNRVDDNEDEEDALLKKMMGFSTFKSTQNTKVPGNNVYGVRKEKKTEYRQYMNRVGGFNRPLSPSR